MKNLTAKCAPGDLFYIPAFSKNGECGFVIARYIELVKPNVGHLIEIFDKHYIDIPKNINEVDKSTRLLRPIMFSMYFKNIPRWKIIFSDPEYDKSESDYDKIAFAFYSYAWIGGKKIDLPKEDLKDMEDSTCWSSEQLIFLVNAYIAGIFEPNERYEDYLVPSTRQISNEHEYAKVVKLAEFINSKIIDSTVNTKG